MLVQAVASLASLTGLEDLRLADCGAITNNGMDVLSSLTRLTALAVVRCPRIADKGLTLLTRLPRLRHLDVTGCSKVGQMGILAGQIHRQNLVPEREGGGGCLAGGVTWGPSSRWVLPCWCGQARASPGLAGCACLVWVAGARQAASVGAGGAPGGRALW